MKQVEFFGKTKYAVQMATYPSLSCQSPKKMIIPNFADPSSDPPNLKPPKISEANNTPIKPHPDKPFP